MERTVEAVLNRLTILSGKERDAAVAELEGVIEANGQLVLSDRCLEQCCEVLRVLLSDAAPPHAQGIAAILHLSANSTVSENGTGREVLSRCGMASIVRAAFEVCIQSNATCYAAMDVISTLASNSGDFRTQFSSSVRHILGAMRAHKSDLDVLFGGCFSLATLTLLNDANVVLLCSDNGAAVLVEVFKYCCRRGKREADPSVKRSLQAVQMWSRATLSNVIKVRGEAVDEAMAKCQFGVQGEQMEVDELKWRLTSDRRVVSAKPAQASAQQNHPR